MFETLSKYKLKKVLLNAKFTPSGCRVHFRTLWWYLVYNWWASWWNALHQYDLVTRAVYDRLSTSFIIIRQPDITHKIKGTIYIWILISIKSSEIICQHVLFPFLLTLYGIEIALISNLHQTSRCLFRRRTFSFLFVLPCFFQGFPTISDAVCTGPTGPLPSL